MANVKCVACGTVFLLEDTDVCPSCNGGTFVASPDKSRVMILQKDRYNVISARDYGEVVWLMEEPLDPFDIKKTTLCIEERMGQLNFDSRRDFIALTGPSSLVAIFLAKAISMYEGVNVLIFDASSSRYRGRRIGD